MLGVPVASLFWFAVAVDAAKDKKNNDEITRDTAQTRKPCAVSRK